MQVFTPSSILHQLLSAMKHLKYFLNLESMNGNATELENMKQEILREMRKEIAKAKLEIIEGNFSQETEI